MMHQSAFSSSGRFDLLLLEEGEVYVRDYVCECWWPPEVPGPLLGLGEEGPPAEPARLEGHLRLASRSLFFEPDAAAVPIVRLSLEQVSGLEMLSSSTAQPAGGPSPPRACVAVQCATATTMRAQGRHEPYATTRLVAPVEWRLRLTYAPLAAFMPAAQQLLALSRLREPERSWALEELCAGDRGARMEEGRSRENAAGSRGFRAAAPSLVPRPNVLGAVAAFDVQLLRSPALERLVFRARARLVEPLTQQAVLLALTPRALYAQPAALMAGAAPRRSHELAWVAAAARRRAGLRDVGLEIFFVEPDVGESWGGRSAFVAFDSRRDREAFLKALQAQDALGEKVMRVLGRQGGRSGALKLSASSHAGRVVARGGLLEGSLRSLGRVRGAWQRGRLSNFDYLLYCNLAAGRTFCDLAQWPVFPWVLERYEGEEELDLEGAAGFRDLCRPMGALDEARLARFRARLRDMESLQGEPGTPKPFLYGSHYSCPAYVSHWLLRAAPALGLRLQGGRFDAPDRLFCSVAGAWRSALSSSSDVRELVPEMFLGDPAFLTNAQRLPLGTRHSGEVVGDVELPPWARGDPLRFLACQRAALEAPYVSANLHHWIDLLFGCKQRGEAAKRADNLFRDTTYALTERRRRREGSRGGQGAEEAGSEEDAEASADKSDDASYSDASGHSSDSAASSSGFSEASSEAEADPSGGQERLRRRTQRAAAKKAEIEEFGQTPRQLFREPHPRRLVAPPAPGVEEMMQAFQRGGRDALALSLLAAIDAASGGGLEEDDVEEELAGEPEKSCNPVPRPGMSEQRRRLEELDVLPDEKWEKPREVVVRPPAQSPAPPERQAPASASPSASAPSPLNARWSAVRSALQERGGDLLRGAPQASAGVLRSLFQRSTSGRDGRAVAESETRPGASRSGGGDDRSETEALATAQRVSLVPASPPPSPAGLSGLSSPSSEGASPAALSCGDAALFERLQASEKNSFCADPGPLSAVCPVAMPPWDSPTPAAVSVSERGWLTVSERASGRRLRACRLSQQPLGALAIVPGSEALGGRLALAGGQAGGLAAFAPGSGRVVAAWQGHSDAASALTAVSASGVAASGSWDGTVSLWDVDAAAARGAACEPSAQPPPLDGALPCLEPLWRSTLLSGGVWALARSAAAPQLLLAGLEDGGLCCLDARAPGRPVWQVELGADYVAAVAALDDQGERVVAGGGDGCARLLDARNGGVLASLQTRSALQSLVGVQGRVILGAEDGSVLGWEPQRGGKDEVVQLGSVPGLRTLALEVDARGVALLAGREDGRIEVWTG